MIDFAAIRNQNPLLDVVSRYVELKRKGNSYVGLCAFHGEKTPSFTVFNSRDGLMRYHCFGCGASGDVVDFLSEIEGVDATEACKRLSAGALPHIGTFKPPIPPPPDESSLWKPIVPVPDDAPAYDPSKTFNPIRGKIVRYQPVRTDVYRDASGRLLCYVVRIELGDGQKICPTVTFCSGPGGIKQWAAKRMQPPYPLLGLDALAARPNDCVLLVSGEKCWQVAEQHMENFVAISWLGGDQAVGSADITPLKNRYIVYWPDADPSSKRSMIDVHNRIGAN